MKINASMQQLIIFLFYPFFVRSLFLLPCSRSHYLIHYAI